jgi:hypothetical protein
MRGESLGIVGPDKSCPSGCRVMSKAKFNKSSVFCGGPLLFLLVGVFRGSCFASGIPEPSLVIYGTVTNVTASGSARMTAGTLTWTNRGDDGRVIVASTRLTNLLDQFSFVLQIPCESQIGSLTVSSNVLGIATPPITYDRSQMSIDGRVAKVVQTSLANFKLAKGDRGLVQRVDLILSFDPIDSDRNSLPDDWEGRFFGRLGMDSKADPDQDGMSNLAEYLSGTDPTDSQSLFKFTKVSAATPAGVLLEWKSQEGKRYTLLRSPSLAPPSFVVVASGLPASPSINQFQDSGAVGPGPFFYQLKVE